MISVAVGLAIILNYVTKLHIDELTRVKFNQKLTEVTDKLKNEDVKTSIQEIAYETVSFASVGDFIPLYNIFLAIQKYKRVDEDVEIILRGLEHFYPELIESRKLDEIENLQVGKELDKRDYFIGQTINGRPINIFFTFDGYNFEIKDYSAKSFMELDDEDKRDILLRLLFVWINGGNKILNGSNNLDELFDEDIVDYLIYLFRANVIEKYDLKEDILKRSRVK